MLSVTFNKDKQFVAQRAVALNVKEPISIGFSPKSYFRFVRQLAMLQVTKK